MRYVAYTERVSDGMIKRIDEQCDDKKMAQRVIKQWAERDGVMHTHYKYYFEKYVNPYK